MTWLEADQRQRALVEARKRGEAVDQLLFVEHPHTVTLGRNARETNLLASREVFDRSGIAVHETNRGGDVTYHGPGQIVGYAILDLNSWQRDVHAYVRALEETVILALRRFGVAGERSAVNSGVWVPTSAGLAKICALGVHLSRWVTSHGFALNVSTDLSYFRYIVPCGLTQPVTSLEAIGVRADREHVLDSLAAAFGGVFGRQMKIPVLAK